ncbi:MAG: hypothetical protein ACRCZS_19285 [Chroococcidiopsis sp.]
MSKFNAIAGITATLTLSLSPFVRPLPGESINWDGITSFIRDGQAGYEQQQIRRKSKATEAEVNSPGYLKTDPLEAFNQSKSMIERGDPDVRWYVETPTYGLNADGVAVMLSLKFPQSSSAMFSRFGVPTGRSKHFDYWLTHNAQFIALRYSPDFKRIEGIEYR